VKDYGISADVLAKGDVFQQLGHGSDAVCGSVVEDVEWCLGVDHQRGDCAVMAGEEKKGTDLFDFLRGFFFG